MNLTKGMANMESLNKFIDLCLIDTYADKTSRGFQLDVSSLPSNEQENFLDQLMQNDSTIRDIVTYHMQKLIDERLSFKESRDSQQSGLNVFHLSNGDIQLRRSAC